MLQDTASLDSSLSLRWTIRENVSHFTICDYDREAGTITIVFQEVGASTVKMADLKAGDSFRDFTGPLGCASELVEEDIEDLKKKNLIRSRWSWSCSCISTGKMVT